MIQLLSEANNKGKDLLHQKILLEVAFIKLATMEDLKPLNTVLDRIEDMKQLIGLGENVKAKAVAVKNEAPLSEPPSEKPSNNAGENADHDLSKEDLSEYGPSVEDPSVDGELDSTWSKVLLEIQRKKKTLWALLRNSRLLTIKSGEATLELPANYLIHKKRLEKPEEKQLIEKCLEQVVGNIVQVRLTISKNGRKMESYSTRNESLTRNVNEQSREAIMNEPIVKKTTEILNGSIVNIRRGKE
jgi:hypothetical protein